MKRYISAILIPCLLLQLCGCYSFRPLDEGENISDIMKSSGRVILSLNNGQNITVKTNDCELITQEKFILFGKGRVIYRNSDKNNLFEGLIDKESVDSIKIITTDENEFLLCWSNGIERTSFEKGDYVFDPNLDPDSSYWLIKNYDSPQLIPVNKLSIIEVEELNWYTTIPFAIISLALFVGLIALGKNLPTGSVLPE